jgi:hypothetical protein
VEDGAMHFLLGVSIIIGAIWLFYVWKDSKRKVKARAEAEARERMQKLRAENSGFFSDDDFPESNDLESRVEELERKVDEAGL